MHSLLVIARARLRGLRYGFLVVPLGMTLALAALAFATLAVDRATGENALSFGVARDADAARTVMSVIAGSLVTVAGVTFSITMVTLQLVSQQFTPRALRTYLADRVTQAVAGAFVGVFTYALIVQRTISAPEDRGEPFIPALSVTLAIVLALAALVLLLVFIDHMARNIQVSALAGSIAQATLASIDRLYPAPFGSPADDDPRELIEHWSAEGDARSAHASRPGYIQTIALDDLPRRVGSRGLRLVLHVAPGDFVTERVPLAWWWPGEDDGDIERALRLAIVVADERDLRQDPGYGIRQLADIAMRAISPGINDPSTAMTCVRYLGAVLERLAVRDFPSRVRRYEGDIVVVARRQEWEEYVDAAFDQIGRYAEDPRVAGALLESATAAAHAAREAGAADRLPALVQAGERIATTTISSDRGRPERDEIEERVAALHAGCAHPAL